MPRKVLVAGGAGFLGSHLCKAFLDKRDEVMCVDNLLTGRRQNIAALENDANFTFIKHDIITELPAEITKHHFDIVASLASPASIPKYEQYAVETLMVGSQGTKQLLDLAK